MASRFVKVSFVFGACMLFVSSALAITYPLTPEQVREAYFLGRILRGARLSSASTFTFQRSRTEVPIFTSSNFGLHTS
jgi:hypothetical protein